MSTYQHALTGTVVTHKKTFNLASWLAGIWTGATRQPNGLPRELATLSDQILLDIGVDPRTVPHIAGETIPRPDLNLKHLATPIWRTTARS